jgi:hypothetical protein
MNNAEQKHTDAAILRKKAEEHMKANPAKANQSTIIDIEMKKLVHELQVHQVELEMQNEELRQSYEIMETALRKYTILYDFAPMGHFTLDRDAGIMELNFTGAEILGDKRIALVNSNFKLFVSDASKQVFNTFFEKLYSGHSKESCDVILGYDQKKLCHAYIEGIVTGDDHQCLLSVVDLTAFQINTP